MDSPKSKIAKYYRRKIDGWDLMSWAASIEKNKVEDIEALEELIHLDDFYANGYHKCVESLLLRTMPQDERIPLGEILMLDSVERLEENKLSSKEFMKEFLDTFYSEIDDSTERCSKWIYRFFNENNGYGFLNLQEMNRRDLLDYVRSLRDE